MPLPTYFTIGDRAFPQAVVDKLEESGDGQLCSNLFYLGRRATLKTSEGIKIVALGGALGQDSPEGDYSPVYSEKDVEILQATKTADVLMTTEWPANVQVGSKATNDSAAVQTSQQCIADLCSALQPRYHFSASADTFFEREPFFHTPTDEEPVTYPITRFLSLAQYGNTNKQKWIYAFSLDPTSAPPTSLPAGTTASPLSASARKRPLPEQETSFRFADPNGYNGDRGRGRQGGRNKRHKGNHRNGPPEPRECFFCLGNENVKTHLVTSIGTEVYLTTSKGPLSTAKTFPPFRFPCHMLIIPHTHSPSFSAIADAELRTNTYEEMQRYRHALNNMLAEAGEGKYGSVTWEVSRSEGVHTHWQWMPVPLDLVERNLVEAAFKVEAENQGYPTKFKKQDVGDGTDTSFKDFFRLIVWSPAAGKNKQSSGHKESNTEAEEQHDQSLVLPLDFGEEPRFNFQFGRVVMAKLLDLEKRADWRQCEQTEVEETADAEAFKTRFEPFDFSLQE